MTGGLNPEPNVHHIYFLVNDFVCIMPHVSLYWYHLVLLVGSFCDPGNNINGCLRYIPR